MGAVNYSSSDRNYTTLGVNIDSLYSYFKDEEIETDEELFTAIGRESEWMWDATAAELDNYSFKFWTVEMKPGYYEGFSIVIEQNEILDFDDVTEWEAEEIKAEIAELKQFLEACADIGLVTTHPGWCTSYRNYTETLEAISETAAQMLSELEALPKAAEYKEATA